MKKYLFLLTLITVLFTFCSKNDHNVVPETEGKATLTFDAIIKSANFSLNQTFIISTKTRKLTQLRDWGSKVTLVKANREEYIVPNSSSLMENVTAELNWTYSYSANKQERVILNEIPAGDYKSIKVSIAVPEKHNNNLSLQIFKPACAVPAQWGNKCILYVS